MRTHKNIFNHNPEALILFSFLFAIIVGSILLKMPISSIKEPLTWLNALFMSTSAVCVTGLSVVDIGKDMTLFGQIIILLLIQLGGLGIMTFSLLFLIFIGRKISRVSQSSITNLSQDLSLENVKYSVYSIIKMTFLMESIGTVLLFLSFKNYYSLPAAFYSAIFHSISAFCNAGFSLNSDSFVNFNTNPYVMSVLMILIVSGGLGFIVIHEGYRVLMDKNKGNKKAGLSLHTKIALTGTVFLIVFGTSIIWLLERNGTLLNMSISDQFFNSLFLSVTSRTAGLNTVVTASLSNPTLILILLLMFIGGCPGSTAGGIKIHTFFSVLSLIRNNMKGLKMASLFKRKIPDTIVNRALTIFVSSFLLIFTAVFLLQLAENLSISHTAIPQREEFFDTLFEAISAFGTVGLSLGTTQYLSLWGKTIAIFLMFLGRIGPLTLGIALQIKQKRNINYEFPNEDIIIS